jgi:hypothetical protein
MQSTEDIRKKDRERKKQQRALAKLRLADLEVSEDQKKLDSIQKDKHREQSRKSMAKTRKLTKAHLTDPEASDEQKILARTRKEKHRDSMAKVRTQERITKMRKIRRLLMKSAVSVLESSSFTISTVSC